MKMRNFTIYDLPIWLNAALEELEQKCAGELKAGSDFYKEILEESDEIIDKYPFISTLTDRDEFTKPMVLSMEETKALSRFFVLESDRRDMEGIQLYLMGCRHMLEFLQLLEML